MSVSDNHNHRYRHIHNHNHNHSHITNHVPAMDTAEANEATEVSVDSIVDVKPKKLPLYVYLCDTTMRHQVWQLVQEFPHRYTIDTSSKIAVELVESLENKYKGHHYSVKDVVLKPYPPPFLATKRNHGSYYRINIVKRHQFKPKPYPPTLLPPLTPTKRPLQPLLNMIQKHKKQNFPTIDIHYPLTG